MTRASQPEVLVDAEGVAWTPDALVVHRAKLPVTLNVAKQSKAMFALHKELRDWRAWAKAQAEDVYPMGARVDVTVEHLRKNRASMPDTGAPILAAKAVIDGLVDAGVLPGDGPDVVRRLVFEPPRIVGWQGLRISLTRVPQ